MENEKKKNDIKSILKSEVRPLIIGLRNDFKALYKKLDEIGKKEPREIQKVEIINHKKGKKVQKVNIENPVEEVTIKNPQEEVSVKESKEIIEKLGLLENIGAGVEYMSDLLLDGFEGITGKTQKVEVVNEKEVRFPKVQKVEVTNKQEPPAVQRVQIENSTPKEAVPVVLTDRDRKSFYNLIATMSDGINLKGVIELLQQIESNTDELEINIGDLIVNLDDVEELLGKFVWEKYDIVTASSATETEVVSYTVPVGKTVRLNRVYATGQACAEFALKINGTTKFKGRIVWTERNLNVDPNLEALAGDIINLTVLHNETGTRNYEALLSGIEF